MYVRVLPKALGKMRNLLGGTYAGGSFKFITKHVKFDENCPDQKLFALK